MEQTNNNCGENLMSTLTIDFSEIVDNESNSENESDDDEECNEDDDEIVLCRCCRCDKWKFIDDIVCIEIQPDKIWKCCDCIAMEVQIEKELLLESLCNKSIFISYLLKK